MTDEEKVPEEEVSEDEISNQASEEETLEDDAATPAEPTPAEPTSAEPTSAEPTSGHHGIVKKTLVALIGLVIVLGLLEVVLAWVGVAPLRDRFDDSYALAPHEPLFEQNGEVFQTREAKLAFFPAQEFDAVKKENTYRIFFLGDSSTYGKPYGDAESYVGVLRKSLQKNAPEKNWELVNCGGVSYASYRISALTEELKNYSPDLFVIYTGHNEFLEERTFRDSQNSVNLFLSPFTYLRSASLFAFLAGRNEDPKLEREVNTILDNSAGPQVFERDPAKSTHVVKQYRQSLEEILAHANACGAKVLLIDPADNLQASPFKSSHGDIPDAVQSRIQSTLEKVTQLSDNQDLNPILSEFAQARDIDPLFANTHFALGKGLLEIKQFEPAYESFLLAREMDVCPLRANKAIHLELRAFANENKLPLVRFSDVLNTQNQRIKGHPVRGYDLFFDHVHPRTEMHGVLAGFLLLELNKLGELSDEGLAKCKSNFALTMQQTVGALEKSDHAKALSNLSQMLSWSGKNADALIAAQEADALTPEDVWVKCQYGGMLEKVGNIDAAEKVYANAVILNPRDPLATFRLARIAFGKERYQEAFKLLEVSKSMTPDDAPESFRQDLDSLLEECKQKLGN